MGHGHHNLIAPGDRPFPLLPLAGAAILILFSLVSVAAYRIFVEAESAPDAHAQVVISRQLRFDDAPDGSVVVRDSTNGTIVKTMPVGEYGFVRATLRGLVRTRKSLGESDRTLPFRVELRESGRLLLIDPSTHQEVDLWAFGASNAQQFAELLETDSQADSGSRKISALDMTHVPATQTDSETQTTN